MVTMKKGVWIIEVAHAAFITCLTNINKSHTYLPHVQLFPVDKTNILLMLSGVVKLLTPHNKTTEGVVWSVGWEGEGRGKERKRGSMLGTCTCTYVIVYERSYTTFNVDKLSKRNINFKVITKVVVVKNLRYIVRNWRGFSSQLPHVWPYSFFLPLVTGFQVLKLNCGSVPKESSTRKRHLQPMENEKWKAT